MKGLTIGIVGSGPKEALPNLSNYKETVDMWIGADRGALYLIRSNLPVDIAVGDFDSITNEELEDIKKTVPVVYELPTEKDETDLELAIQTAIKQRPITIYLFGVTSGRKDHELINIQMLYRIKKAGIVGKIIDRQNQMEIVLPGEYSIEKDAHYPYISFIPFSEQVDGLTLEGFIYPLKDKSVSWGSTLCISNELSKEIGHLSYKQGILLIVRSRDAVSM